MNVPAEKAMDFWPSARRLLGTLRPECPGMCVVGLMGVGGLTVTL
jgi:ATP-binding cassette subfamily B protein